MNKTFLKLILSAALILSASWLYSESSSIKINIFDKNKKWDLTSLHLEKGVMGSPGFVRTDMALKNETLELSASSGYNEVTYRDPVNLKHLSFDFFISDPAELHFEFNKSPRGYSGIRLSDNESAPSMYYQADELGEFTQLTPFKTPALKNKWNNFSIDFGNETLVYLNSEKVFTVPKTTEPQGGTFAFRSKLDHTEVDNVSIQNQDGTTYFEDFAPKNGFKSKANLSICALLIAVAAGVYLLTPFLVQSVFMGVCFILFLLASLVHFGENTSYNYLQKFTEYDVSSIYNNIELEDSIMKRALESTKDSPTDPYRILLVGSSQTWGAGAMSPENTYDVYLKKNLQNLNPTRHLFMINIAVSGYLARQELDLYMQIFYWHPHLVVFNMASNDRNRYTFKDALETLLEINKKYAVPTVLIEEANSPELKEKQYLYDNHTSIRQLAKEYRLKVIKLDQYMQEQNSRGFLWWDYVHMTSLGQKYAAAFIAQQLSPLAQPRY